MPTIDQLTPARTVSDSDALALWQSGSLVRATRAQLLTGLAPEINLRSGELLGRATGGTGGVGPIQIGANLTLTNGVLSAPSPFNAEQLDQGSAPGLSDRVVLIQENTTKSVDYTTFMSGLANTIGIDISACTVTSIAGQSARSLSRLAADTPTIESFGAVGDGVTDDTLAFVAAALRGGAIRLGCKSYAVNGPIILQENVALLGVAGFSKLVTTGVHQAGSWIIANCGTLLIDGVTFDAKGSFGDFSLLSIASSCVDALVSGSSFADAPGAGSGHGISIMAADAGRCMITDCKFSGNSGSGLSYVGSGYCSVVSCLSTTNGENGLNFTGGANICVRDCDLQYNGTGLSYGDLNGFVNYGLLAGSATLCGNRCMGNRLWGFNVYGVNSEIVQNSSLNDGQIAVGGAVRAQIRDGIISGNFISCAGNAIDARSSAGLRITDNLLLRCANGIQCGGTQRTVISGNSISASNTGVAVQAIDNVYSLNTSDNLSIRQNDITLVAATAIGVLTLDAVVGVNIVGNNILSGGIAGSQNAMRLNTDCGIVAENSWNGIRRPVVIAQNCLGNPTLVIPDTADAVLLSGGESSVQNILTESQLDALGQITFIRITAGGSGYTTASVEISGSGAGASATAIIENGAILWVIVTNPGSGYGPNGAATAVIVGDGVGATLAPCVGLPNIDGRRLHLVTRAAIEIVSTEDAAPLQTWSQYSVSVPAFSCAEFEVIDGSWCLTSSSPVPYLDPVGQGGLLVKALNGNPLTLFPTGGGAVQMANDIETTGVLSLIGRGSPEGILVAPAGSDYRNLNGGVQETLWIKQTGSDNSGWVSIA